MLWLNYFSILALILAYVAPYVNPSVFWPIAFMGLGYPILLVLNLFFIVYWFAQMRVLGLWSLLNVAVGWNSFLAYVQFSYTETPANKDIKVMSYNCMLFDLYNWSHNAQSRRQIFNMLQEESPDILCLQEFFTRDGKSEYNNLDTLGKFLAAKNQHAEYAITLRKIDHWGLITLSKYPIIRKGKILFNTNSNNLCIYTDLLIHKDTVRVYNVHLASIHFGKKEYKFIDQLLNNDSISNELEESKSILRRIKRAFITRSEQSLAVAKHIAACKYKKIVCGDFNDTPSSFAYRRIKDGLNDAFISSGSGIGKTYAGKLPALRIDYILYSKGFESYNYKRAAETFTDHYPVSCYLREGNHE